MSRRDSKCPLCGGNMSTEALLDACDALIDAELGVLSAHCPHCQGYLEIRPTNEKVDIGYLVGSVDTRFDVALSLPYAGFKVAYTVSPPTLTLTGAHKSWAFS